jgi:N-acetylneuraminic acid mutarotase
MITRLQLRIISRVLLLSLFILPFCTTDEDYDFALIQTGEVTDISSQGAVFHARLTTTGSSGIEEWGFVWSLSPDPGLTSSRYSQTGSPALGSLSANITSDLISGHKYYVRAYAKNSKFLSFGKAVTFNSVGSVLPSITGFSPAEGTGGTQITITGSGFSASPTGNVVKFGHLTASIIASEADHITVVLPENRDISGKVYITVSVSGNILRSAQQFNLTGPNIIGFTPGSVCGGDILAVKADNLDQDPVANSVVVNDLVAELLLLRNDSLYISVPYNSPEGKSEVSLLAGGMRCFANDSLVVKNPWSSVPNSDSWNNNMETSFAIGDYGYVVVENQLWRFKNGEFRWHRMADLPGEYRNGTIGFSVGGKGYVCFGTINGTVLKNVYEYDPETNLWTQKNDFPGAGRFNAVSMVIDSKAYLGLGEALGFVGLKDFWVYDPQNDSWTSKANFPGPGSINVKGFIVGKKGYLGLGHDPASNYGNDFWEYEPATDAWRAIAQLPGDRRSGAASFAVNGSGYVGTGGTGTYFYSVEDFWRYDVKFDRWCRIADVPTGPRINAQSFVFGNKAYLCVGNFQNQDFIEFNPN